MRKALEVCVIALVCSAGLWAQAESGTGSVTGTVREAAGDGIPDTTVQLTNKDLSLLRTMVTSDDGLFYAPGLIPAKGYRLKVTRKGFTGWDSPEFEVLLGQAVQFTIDLKTEAEAAQTQPTGVVAAVDTGRNGVSTLIGPQQSQDLPAGARHVDPLVQQAPAVNQFLQTGETAFVGQAVGNSLVQDGIWTTNGYYRDRPALANQLPLDSVSELQVFAGGAPPEFGHFIGGTVNAASPSGGNSFHGQAEDFVRLSSLGATDKYALGRNLLRGQNEAGGNVGGPVQQGHIFFFASATHLEGNFDGLNRIANPLIADPAGTTVLTSNCKATTPQCTAAEKFIQSQMNVLVPFSNHWTTGLAKVDYRRSDRNSFSVEANAMNSLAPATTLTSDVAPNGGLLGLQNTSEHIRYGKASWISAPTHSTVNEMRFGLLEDRIAEPPSTAGLSTGNVGVSIAGTTIGNPQPAAFLLSERREELVDNFTFTSGAHTLRGGIDYPVTRDYLDTLPNAAGAYYYNSLTAFAQDFAGTGLKNYTLFQQQFGNATRTVQQREYDLYGQDTWRATSRLTVNAGVRWEKPHLPQPTTSNSSYYQTSILNAPVNDFSPRVGLAYLLNDKTVFRAGYGWYFAPYPGQFVDTMVSGNGYQTNIVVTPTQTGAPAFPKVIAGTSTIPNGTTDLIFADAKLRNPHTAQINAAIERRLTSDTTVTLTAMESRGYKFWALDDINLAAPTKLVTYAIDNAAGQQVNTYQTYMFTAKNDPKYAQIYDVKNVGSFWYYGGSLDVRKRMTHGISVQGSYTWSHAISDTSGQLGLGGVPLTSNNGNTGYDRADAPTDQRSRVVLNWIWQPMPLPNTSPLARYVVNGWQVSALAVIASGEPVTELALPVGQQFSTATMVYTTSMNGGDGWQRVPFINPDTLRTGSQRNVDVRLTRTIPFTERVKGMVMLEAYNVLNRQPATTLQTIAYTGTTTLPTGAVNGPFSSILRPVPDLGLGLASQGYPDGTSARRLQVAFRVVF
jgi:hypothetical protein